MASLKHKFTIDFSKAVLAENFRFRGNGMVSANNSSRLLIDYKALHPKSYWEILNYIFGEKGINVTHLKIEMGSDINSSSGTEPCIMRSENDVVQESSSGAMGVGEVFSENVVDVRRGAGFVLAADAKKINPDLTLDMLWWSEPIWIEKFENKTDVYEARYKWYKANLDAAYKTFGLKFDYVSATQNERAADDDWTKFLSKKLKSETDGTYDFSKIKIVDGDEVCTWGIADRMKNDAELCDAIDVIGSHYTSFSTDNAKWLAMELGKELWFSESSSPMNYPQGTFRFNGGLAGMNGVIDMATRFVTMWASGKMTLCEYQPVVAAYYDGVCYCQKQMILANEPWSGRYVLDAGFFMSLHFSQFIKKGWAFVDGASFADGKVGGDGHAIVDSKFNYMTAMNPETGDWSCVIVNATDEAIEYEIELRDVITSERKIYVWETRGADKPIGENSRYNENYFKLIDTIPCCAELTDSHHELARNEVSHVCEANSHSERPKGVEESHKITFTAKPQSIATLSTVELNPDDYPKSDENKKSEILQLPYEMDFDCTPPAIRDISISSDTVGTSDKKAISAWESRGSAPYFTTDQGGAFEITKLDGENVLQQKITLEIKAAEWGGTPNPTTNFGDDRWKNYSVSAKVKFEKSESPEKNYVGVGLRYILAANGESGYWLRLFENGKAELMKNNAVLASADLTSDKFELVKNNAVLVSADLTSVNVKESFVIDDWVQLKISASENVVCGFVNGEKVLSVIDDGGFCSAGRAAIYSSYNKNYFSEIKCEPLVDLNDKISGKNDSDISNSPLSPYITRYDNTDSCFSYNGNWEHNLMSSFKNFRRTISTGTTGDSFTFDFEGTGFSFFGETEGGAVLKITLDGNVIEKSYSVPKCNSREISFASFKLTNDSLNSDVENFKLTNSSHKVIVEILEGKFSIDGAEV